MRIGDFGVEVVAAHGNVKELDSGHVLARPGQVYRLRLRNYGPLRCVVDATIDGRSVTGGGLVLRPWSSTELERPIDAAEHGCFTVVAEGNETVFGPDGGRDNPALGLIEARFRRELPSSAGERPLPPSIYSSLTPFGIDADDPRPTRLRPVPSSPRFNALRRPEIDLPFTTEQPSHRDSGDRAIERAAGTGLTGHSDQEFVPITLGALEPEATTLILRLVIGTEAALADASTRTASQHDAPARPAARP